MIASAARIAANRRNALKSTGPKTPEGKDAARRNALKHGLTAVSIPPAEDASAFESRAASFRQTLRPASDYHAWLVDEVAATTLRLDRARRMERQLRDGASFRALTCWDDDRRLDAERLGATLDRRPAAVAAELRATPQGIDWLIARWDLLADAAGCHPWTADQSRLAAHLLGTPSEAEAEVKPTEINEVNRRSAGNLDSRVAEGCGPRSSPRLDHGPGSEAPCHPEEVKSPVPDEAELAHAMLAELRTLRDRMAEADDVARATVAAGLGDMGQPDLARLRRYERDLQRRLHWCHDRLQADPATPTHSDPRTPVDPTPPAPPVTPPVAADPVTAPGRNEPTPTPAPDETKPLAPAAAFRLDLDIEDQDEADDAEARAWVASLQGLTPDQKQKATLAAAQNILGRLESLDQRLARHQRRPDLKKALARRDHQRRR